MIKAGIFGFDGGGILVPISDWLIPLDEAERWLQSKGIHVNFDEFRAMACGPSGRSIPTLVATIEAVPAPASGVSDCQLQARKIADGCFNTYTRNRCRSSLQRDSESVMEPMQTAAIKSDEAKTLADLFDPVRLATLERMFPADGKWKIWGEKSRANGLGAARTSHGFYNPYIAGMWFANRVGWDLAHCHRVLANNLPARSRDEKFQLTDY
jgi:hypothetical protein